MDRMTVDALNGLDHAGVVERLGAALGALWIAQAVADGRPYASLTALHAAAVAAIAAAPQDAQLALLAAQDGLPDGDAYAKRFGFPFLLAGQRAGSRHVAVALANRLANPPAAERPVALAELAKTLWLRLLDAVEPRPSGRLTTHVLDTATGLPAAGLPVDLYRLEDGRRVHLKSAVTNDDGRLGAPALAGTEFTAGTYELLFHAGLHFAATGAAAAPPFVDEVPVRFAVANPELHYHVPLLVSPWAFSTYRGS